MSSTFKFLGGLDQRRWICESWRGFRYFPLSILGSMESALREQGHWPSRAVSGPSLHCISEEMESVLKECEHWPSRAAFEPSHHWISSAIKSAMRELSRSPSRAAFDPSLHWISD